MKNLIGNDWKDSSSLNVVEVINPATSSLIDTVPSSTVDDVVLAIGLAKNAFSRWEDTTVFERGEILTKFAKLLKEDKEELANVFSEESGKALKESLSEIDSFYNITLSLIANAKNLYGTMVPNGIENEKDYSLQFTNRTPLGIVGVILPGVFKLELLAHKLVSALLMGNAVIVKPSSKAPLLVTKIVYMLRQAGIYEGVVQVIHGDGKVVGQAIAMHPDVSLVTFNGTTANGIRVMTAASKNLTKTVLGLEANNAFVLCKDGDVDLAVEEAAKGRFYNAGQLNSANKRFIIHKSLKEEFINKLIRKIGSVKLGEPNDKDTDLGCLITEDAAKKVEKQVNDMIAAGAKLVIGGRRSGAFYEPTILTDIDRKMPVALNLNINGPVIPIIEFENLNDAVDIVNESVYADGVSIFTKNLKIAFKLAAFIQNGEVVVNGSTVNYVNEISKEGWKYSGTGKEGLVASLEEMSKVKTVILKDILD